MSKKLKKYECELCTEKMTDNYRVICPFCNVEICETCFQYSITMELKNPICLYCKKQLTLEFVLSNNATAWCKEVFIPYFENLCLEKEKSYLQDAIPDYKKMIKIRELKRELNKFPSNKKLAEKAIEILLPDFSTLTKKQIKELDVFDETYEILLNEKLNKKEEILDEINSLEDNKIDKSNDIEKKIYISNCPNEKCRGFITNQNFCDICNLEMCDSCMEEKLDNHICNRNAVKSANLIKESSKPCPKCYVPIFKSSGCNQMFCTSCHVVFDWETMKIDKGNVHNAHYFEWMTSQNNRENINLDEVACGNVEEIYRNLIFKMRKIFNMYQNEDRGSIRYYEYNFHKNLKYIFELNRIFNGEIIDSIRNNLIKQNFKEYRIQYLDKKISEKSWKSKIAKDNLNNEKYKSLIEILEMYITVTSDFIRQLAFKNLEISELELKNIFKEYDQKIISFQNHFKKSIDDLMIIFGGTLNNRLQFLIYNQNYRY